jgi:hypothetical protein
LTGPRQLELYKRTDEILLRYWDLIGVSGIPEAEDEYHSYLPQVVRLAVDCADQHKISECLFKVETGSMRLPGDKQRCKQTAEMVLRAKNELGL